MSTARTGRQAGQRTHENTPRRRRRYVPFRMWPEAYEAVREMAATETEGDVSRMIRTLLAEAMAARATRGGRRG